MEGSSREGRSFLIVAAYCTYIYPRSRVAELVLLPVFCTYLNRAPSALELSGRVLSEKNIQRIYPVSVHASTEHVGLVDHSDSMSEIINPQTPSPERTVRHSNTSPMESPGEARDVFDTKRAAQNAGAITPPPSSQISKSTIRSVQAKFTGRREHSLASPPATLKTGPPITSVGLFGEAPSIETVQTMNEDQLRTLIMELLPALGEARVTAAHSKLQHSLLAIENEESAKRAEVEHEATRREVEVLQEGSPIQRHGFSGNKSPHAYMQRNLHLALAHCRELQHENAILEKRLWSSKKLIAQLDGKNAELRENVQRLRQRIKDNRDHLNEMQSSGAISIHGTPMSEYSTPLPKGTPRTPATSRPIRDIGSETIGSQDPFDTLLFAGQILDGGTSSVPSTPHQSKPRKTHPHHVRGAHSLSSLPNTPSRSRPVTADNALITSTGRSVRSPRVSFSAPGTQLTYDAGHEREDRDSTISVSENEDESFREHEVPASQASQVASRMLRRSLGSHIDNSPAPGQTQDSSKLMQGKLFGQVKKSSGLGTDSSSKRGGDVNSYDEIVRSTKKARVVGGSERVGLGIEEWPSPGQ